ncbi:hypothetical protein QOZ80_1AG0048270 [Eleusine coracana subsp. coracana]|nr:hypothetical protein QOZ80_1AG0048270 [Eleusine coracana subsp. coracana]
MFGLQASGAAASWVVGRMGTDAHLYDDPDDAAIPDLLDSRFDADKVDALKRLLALIAQGVDVSHHFPQVVKNVASQSLEVKKLVYLYLLHYAEKRQNEALLSINIFQKDLADINPLVRAWALRTMAGIRLHVVAPLVLLAVKKCARDPSPYVRKCAAFALCKLCDLLPHETAALQEIVDTLFADNSQGVVGAAAVAFKSVCPSAFALISKHFRRHGLVKGSTLVALDTSTEIQGIKDSGCQNTMSTLPDITGNGICGAISNAMLFRHYIEEYSGFLEREDNSSSSITTNNSNDDIAILLKSTSPLLWSRNTGVILAAASVHWIMAPIEELKRIVGPILFTLRSSHDAAYVMLGNILVFAKRMPSLFAPFYDDFFINASDPYLTRALKLEILTSIATEQSIPAIFEEFQDYIKDPDRKFVADTVAAIALCAQKIPSISSNCIEGLLGLVFYESSISDSVQFDGEDAVLVQAILSIKAIVKMNPVSHEKVIIRLVRRLDKIKGPMARSLITWIFGEYSSTGDLIPKIVPVVLKYLAWSFAADAVETKLQILNASAKVIIHSAEEQLEELKTIVAYIIDQHLIHQATIAYIFQVLFRRGTANSSRRNNSDTESESSTYKSSSVYDSESEEQGQTGQHAEENLAALISTDLTELMSKSALESWLDEAPAEPVVQDSTRTSVARVSFTNHSFERKPKLHVLLDSSDSNGLSVLYAFSSDVSPKSRLLVCIDLYFENVTTHQLTDISIKCEGGSSSEDAVHQTPEGSPSIPTIVPMEEICSLAPQQALRGMFEYARRCTFKDHLQKLDDSVDGEHTDKNLMVANTLASKILSNANFHLVSMDMPVTFNIDDASGLCWRFGSEIMSTSNACLITIVAEGHTSGPLDLTAKVNSEDTAFALNLLNRVVALLE